MAAGSITSISVGPGNTFSLRRPAYVESVVLSTAPLTWQIPAGGTAHLLFSASVDFCAAYSTSTAGSTGMSMPTTNPTTDGSGSELNPSMREVNGVVAVTLIAPTTGYCTISAWRV